MSDKGGEIAAQSRLKQEQQKPVAMLQQALGLNSVGAARDHGYAAAVL
jgi:hypothetical protein